MRPRDMIRAWRDTRECAEQLNAEGAFNGLTESQAIALIVATMITPEKVKADPRFDWQGFAAFIIAIAPIIIQIFSLLNAPPEPASSNLTNPAPVMGRPTLGVVEQERTTWRQ